MNAENALSVFSLTYHINLILHILYLGYTFARNFCADVSRFHVKQMTSIWKNAKCADNDDDDVQKVNVHLKAD